MGQFSVSVYSGMSRKQVAWLNIKYMTEESLEQAIVKVINAYNKDAKAEVPTKVEAIVDLMGQEILIGVIKQTVDKTKKNEATGTYEPTGETREENEIDKFFRARDRMTTAEIRAKAETAAFADTWSAKWTGKSRDKSKGASAAGTAGMPGRKPAAAAQAAGKPANSLFA